MTEIDGMSHLDSEVQEFVKHQFTLHGTLSQLRFHRTEKGGEFKVVSRTPGKKCDKVFVTGPTHTAYNCVVTGDGVVEQWDLWALNFSPCAEETRAEVTSQPQEIDGINSKLLLNKYQMERIDKTKEVQKANLVGGKWNGYPMSDEISSHDALYAICKLDGVFLHGQRLVLRDGAWHLPKK